VQIFWLAEKKYLLFFGAGDVIFRDQREYFLEKVGKDRLRK